MSKWIVFIALVLVFNVVMGVGFVWANNLVWDYLNKQINEVGGNKGEGNFVIPFILDSGLHVTVGHEFWSENETLVNLGPLPIGVPNYPFIVFWVYAVGNLGFIACALVLHETGLSRLLKRMGTGLSTLLKRMENRIAKNRETS